MGAQQPALSPARLVFIDETWATTTWRGAYGRAGRGRARVGAVPHGHWKTTTLIAALGRDGLTAPGVFDGAINGDRFAPSSSRCWRRPCGQGDVVVMDNLSHKVAGGRRGDRGGRRRRSTCRRTART